MIRLMAFKSAHAALLVDIVQFSLSNVELSPFFSTSIKLSIGDIRLTRIL